MKKKKKKRKDKKKEVKPVDADEQMDRLFGPDENKIKVSLPKKDIDKLERLNERRHKEVQQERLIHE